MRTVSACANPKVIFLDKRMMSVTYKEIVQAIRFSMLPDFECCSLFRTPEQSSGVSCNCYHCRICEGQFTRSYYEAEHVMMSDWMRLDYVSLILVARSAYP